MKLTLSEVLNVNENKFSLSFSLTDNGVREIQKMVHLKVSDCNLNENVTAFLFCHP